MNISMERGPKKLPDTAKVRYLEGKSPSSCETYESLFSMLPDPSKILAPGVSQRALEALTGIHKCKTPKKHK